MVILRVYYIGSYVLAIWSSRLPCHTFLMWTFIWFLSLWSRLIKLIIGHLDILEQIKDGFEKYIFNVNVCGKFNIALVNE